VVRENRSPPSIIPSHQTPYLALRINSMIGRTRFWSSRE
jgi:hypothetical protein